MSFYDHPAFQGIDKNFLMNMERQLNSLRGKGEVEAMSTLLTIANDAKRYNVAMTPERQQLLMQYLRGNLPANKRAQFDTIIQFMMNNMRK